MIRAMEVNSTLNVSSDYIYLFIDTFNKQCDTYDLPFKMVFNGSMEELYEDDGVTNNYKNGVYKKTLIQMQVKPNITIDFTSEGSYETPIEQVTLDVVYPMNAPLAVLLDGQPLPHFLYNKKFDAADCGWYYNLSTKSIEIKYPAPKKNYQIL